MKPTADYLVDDYLERLRRELSGLPGGRRRELLQKISEHIAEGRASLPGDDEAGVRALLDRLGDPEYIAAAARLELLPRRVAWKEIAALVLLPIVGLIVPVSLLVLAEESSGCGTLFTPQLSPQPNASSTCPPSDGSGVFGATVWEVAFVIALGVVSLALAALLARRCAEGRGLSLSPPRTRPRPRQG